MLFVLYSAAIFLCVICFEIIGMYKEESNYVDNDGAQC